MKRLLVSTWTCKELKKSNSYPSTGKKLDREQINNSMNSSENWDHRTDGHPEIWEKKKTSACKECRTREHLLTWGRSHRMLYELRGTLTRNFDRLLEADCVGGWGLPWELKFSRDRVLGITTRNLIRFSLLRLEKKFLLFQVGRTGK